MVLSTLLLMTAASTVIVDGDVYVEREFRTASQLAPWCREEAEAHVIATGKTPYQWTASHHDRGDVLIVEGKLRVEGGNDVAVTCRIARGARERYASIVFGTPH
jgi:hypothetical protein